MSKSILFGDGTLQQIIRGPTFCSLFEMKTFGGSMESVPQLEEVEYEIPKRFT